MAVFNAAANQVLAQPVSAFYQGKALRTQQERAELENRALQREEDYAAENRRMAKQDRERRIAAEDLATEQVKQQIAQGDRDALSYRVNLLAPAINARLLVDVFRKTDGEYKAQNFADENGNIQFTAIEGSPEWYEAVQNPELFLAGNVSQAEPAQTNIYMPSEDFTEAVMKGTAGHVADAMNKRDEQAHATYGADQQHDRMILALARGARAGYGEQFILDVRGLLDTIGLIKLSPEAAQSEVISALGNQAAMTMRNPNSGKGLPGATSNKDLEFLRGATAGIWRSEEGMRLFVDYSKRESKFKRALSAEQYRIIAANINPRTGEPEVPMNLNAQLADFHDNYQFYTDEEQAEIEAWMETAVDINAPPPGAIKTDLANGTYEKFIVLNGIKYNFDGSLYTEDEGSPQ